MWFDLFKGTLYNKILTQIRHYSSDRKLIFGKGVLKFLFYVQLPISMAGEKFLINFDVVDSDLPFLLRKK